VFKSRTLLAILSFLLVVFIVAIVISPVVDIPEAGLKNQTLAFLFFGAIVAAMELCLGLLCNQYLIRTPCPHDTASETALQPGAVLLC